MPLPHGKYTEQIPGTTLGLRAFQSCGRDPLTRADDGPAVSAYYNENDAFNVAWLRELIKRGLIAPGEVDERSIAEVRPADLAGFTQCHFFAGIGVWSYALRCAGWPDGRPVWTASCPCPPFSSAGKKKACPHCRGTNPVPHVGRTGYFVCCLCGHEWLADARHLYPELWRLVRDGRPVALFGEQVAGRDGRIWLVLVRASLQILGYACRPANTCAGSFGAPHIRQRLYFVAESDGRDARTERLQRGGEYGQLAQDRSTGSGTVAHAKRDGGRSNEQGRRPQGREVDGRDSAASGMADTENSDRWSGERGAQAGIGQNGERRRRSASDGTVSELGDTGFGNGAARLPRDKYESGSSIIERFTGSGASSFWSDAEWLPCRDGKARPVERATKSLHESLADGVADDLGLVFDGDKAFFSPLIFKGKNRVGRLRGYGNALVAPQAKAFIEAAMTCSEPAAAQRGTEKGAE